MFTHQYNIPFDASDVSMNGERWGGARGQEKIMTFSLSFIILPQST